MPFTQTDDPNFVQDEQGRLIPVGSVDPSDIVMSVDTSPLSVPQAAPVGTPTAPSAAVAAAEAKLDTPELAPFRQGNLVRAGAQVQRGIDTSGMQQDNLNRATDLGNEYKETAAAKYKRQADLNERVANKTAEDIADAEKARAQNQVARESARKQELALRDQKDPELDPDQFMRENGLGMVLLAGLSGALGSFTKNGGDNGAAILKALDRRIDLNIEAQKAQIASGRLRRGNLIDYYVKQGLDAKEAEAAAKALYYAKSAEYVQLNKEHADLADGPANANLFAKTLLSNAETQNQQLQIQGADKVTETYAAPKPKAKVDVNALIKKQTDTKKALEESGASEEVQRAAWAAGGTGLPFPTGKSTVQEKRDNDKRIAEKPTEAQAKKTEALNSLRGLADTLVGLPDRVYTREARSLPKRMAHGVADFVAGEGSGEKFDLTLSAKDLSDSQRFTQARESYLSQLSVLNGQGAMAGQEYINAKNAAMAANSPAQLRAAIANTLQAHGANLGEDIQVEDR